MDSVLAGVEGIEMARMYLALWSLAAAVALTAGVAVVGASNRVDATPTAINQPAIHGMRRTETVLSANVANGAQVAPVATGLPAIQGAPVVGAVLSGTPGTWSGRAIKYSISWMRCDSAGAACTEISGAHSTKYDVARGDAGSTIRISVMASNRAGSTAASSAATATVPGRVSAPAPETPDSTSPSAPTALTASAATPTSVSLQWSPASDNVGVTGYTVSTNGGAAASTPSTAFSVGGLRCGTANTFAVEAVDAAGNSSAATTISSRTSACLLDTQPPTAPGALRAGNSTGTTLAMSWSASTDDLGVAGYEIALNGTVVGSGPGTSFTVTGLTCGSSYTISVDAVDTSGNRSQRVSLTAATAACATTSSIYWGAYMEGKSTYDYLYGPTGFWQDAPWGGAGNTWDRFEQSAGKKVSIEHYGQPPPWEQAFDAAAADLVVNRGAIPAIDMSTKNVALRDIANGTYDASITAWARAAKAWGHPFFFLPDEEMNGTWEPYSVGVNGNTAADFVSAWRHMHDIFASVGASNVTWVWDVNIDPHDLYPAYSQLYPGDAYVDWTALNGYNWGSSEWTSFSDLFSSSYARLLQLAPTKPIMIGEISSAEAGGSKAAWITDTLSTQLPQSFPRIKAILWFNWRIYEKSAWWPWEIESSASAQQAFANSIGSSYYAPGGQFGNLPSLTKIAPPG